MPNRLLAARTEFERRVTGAQDFVARCQTAKNSLAGRSAFVADQMEWMYETALLKIVVASEQFFEVTLGLYVTGHRAPNGYRPRRLKIIRSSLPAILEIFRGDLNFVGWNEPSAIINRAERWLKDGGRYQPTLSAASQLLSYLRKMRNSIAHESDSATQTYTMATRSLYGALPKRVTPGAQLMRPPPAGIPGLAATNLFEASLSTYRLIAQQIVP